MRGRAKISKFMSYILRHNPMGPIISPDGFVTLEDLLSLIQKRYPWLDRTCLQEIVGEDEKGRYELKGNSIRARYGHSIDVAIDLPLLIWKPSTMGPQGIWQRRSSKRD
jgi:putative RNA 2'-phosphotransferase